MSAATALDQKRAECVRVCDRIRKTKSALDADYERRRSIFLELIELGMKRNEIAALAGVEPMTVTYALKPKAATPSA